MNHKALAIAPVVAVAALALTAIGFAIPQQALAYGHHHHNNHHSNNQIDVDQQITQINNCTNTFCHNDGQNQVDIDR
jgi:hypothetical protein